MKLHAFDGSTTCRPVVMFAQEAGIGLELVPVDLFAGEQARPAYLALNPNGKVPLLQDGDVLLTESSAILKYLAELSASPAYPAGIRARAGQRPDGLVQYGLLPQLRLRRGLSRRDAAPGAR